MLIYAFDLTSAYEPLFWVLFYLSSIAINIAGGSIFWNFNYIIGLVSLLLILVYILGSIPEGNFDSYAGNAIATRNHTFDIEGTMEYLPFAAWFFIGIESLPLCGRDCNDVSHLSLSLSFLFVSVCNNLPLFSS